MEVIIKVDIGIPFHLLISKLTTFIYATPLAFHLHFGRHNCESSVTQAKNKGKFTDAIFGTHGRLA